MERDDQIAAAMITVLGGSGIAIVFFLAGLPVVVAAILGYAVVAGLVIGISWVLWGRGR